MARRCCSGVSSLAACSESRRSGNCRGTRQLDLMRTDQTTHRLVAGVPIQRRTPYSYTGNLYRQPVYLLYSSCERSHAAGELRTRVGAGIRDPCYHRQTEAVYTRARGKARSQAVAGFCSSATGEGWFGHCFHSGAGRRRAPAIDELCGRTIAGGWVGPGCPGSERRTSDSDVSHAQVPEVASGRQGRKTGLVDDHDLAEAFHSRAGEASRGTRTAGATY